MPLINVEIVKPDPSEDRACSCDGKVRYGHRKSAERAVSAMRRKGRGGLEPYPCSHCGGWHVGHGIGRIGKTLTKAFRALARPRDRSDDAT